MGNSFQEQLLKAGLVNKKQLKKAKHESRVSKKQPAASGTDQLASQVRQEQEAKKQRARELNRQLLAEKAERERQAQVKQLIEQHRLPKDERGEAYNFVDGTKIKRIRVAAAVVDQLSRGQAAIVRLGNGYEVVPAQVARQVESRDPEALLVLHDPAGNTDEW